MDAPLLLWPGMGVDARMYDPLARRLPTLRTLPWAEARGTLGEHAQRLVDAGVVPRGAIVGGSSFGGFLALEVARRSAARAVVLIGSATATAEIARWLLALAPLAAALPDAPPAAAAAEAVGGVAFGLHAPAHRRLFAAMARATPPAFVRWACAATASWEGVADAGCQIVRVHGARDRLLPARRARGASVIAGAGHLPALTHPDDVADALRRGLAAEVNARVRGG